MKTKCKEVEHIHVIEECQRCGHIDPTCEGCGKDFQHDDELCCTRRHKVYIHECVECNKERIRIERPVVDK